MTRSGYGKYAGFILALGILCWWAFFSSARQQAHDVYTQAHYHTDTANIYMDLAKSALKRKDYLHAAKAYTAALGHEPNLLKAHQGLQLANKHLANRSMKKQF